MVAFLIWLIGAFLTFVGLVIFTHTNIEEAVMLAILWWVSLPIVVLAYVLYAIFQFFQRIGSRLSR